jgi:hypothetical protein
VPPPMTKDEAVYVEEKKQRRKAAEKAADAVRAEKAKVHTDPDLAKFQRGDTKSKPIFKNNTTR